MDIREIVELLLSSALVAGLFNTVIKNREFKLKYIIGARIEEKNTLKSLMEELAQVSSKGELRKVINRLKPLLKGYGKKEAYEEDIKLDIVGDEHIWKLLDKIEKSSKYRKRHRDKLINYLALRLQFEEEKIEKEVKPEYSFVLFNLIYIIGVAIGVFELRQIEGIKQQIIICYVGILLVWYLPWLLVYILKKMKMFQIRNWYRDTGWLMTILIVEYLFVTITDIFFMIEGVDGKIYLYWYLGLFMKMIGVMGMFLAELNARNMYVEYNRRVSQFTGEWKITLYYYKDGTKFFWLTDILSKWNLYYDFIATKERGFDYAGVILKLAEGEKMLKRWNWRLDKRKSFEEKVKYLNKHPRKVNLICQYKGKVMIVRKRDDLRRLIEENS